MSTFELAKEFIASRRYQILDEDSSEGHIAFRFQMNTIHFWGNPDDENFFFMTLPNFADVTDENIAQVKENCHRINKEAKLVKYTYLKMSYLLRQKFIIWHRMILISRLRMH